MDKLVIFLSYVFQSEALNYTKAEMENNVEQASKTAELSLRALKYDIEIQREIYLENFGEGLNQQVIEVIKKSDIVIVDVSEHRPNVIYELGIAHGMLRHTILLQQENAPPLFPDTEGRLTMRYRHINDIRGQLAQTIVQAVQAILARRDRFPLAMRQFWGFGEQTLGAIHVIGPDTRRRDALSEDMVPGRDYPDFARMELLGDKDSILEVQMQLARMYPSPPIYTHPSSRFPRIFYEEALVIIGGPVGGKSIGKNLVGEFSGGNRLTRVITELYHLPISYKLATSKMDDEALIFQEQEYRIDYDEKSMTTDYGVIARLPNPWNRERRIFLFHGVHTYGVLGAVRAFLVNSKEGRDNAETVKRVCGPDPLFYAWCRVDIVDEVLTIALVKETNIVRFSEE